MARTAHPLLVCVALLVVGSLLGAPPAAADQRVLLIGDSNIYGPFGQQLELALERASFHVVRYGKPGTGMARPDYFDWRDRAARLLERHDPDIVIMMFGGNDAQRVLFVGPPKKARVHWRYEAHWRFAYGQRVRDLAKLLRGREGLRRVFLLGPTNRRSPIGVGKLARIRQVQQRAVSGLDGVTWVDMFPHSSDRDGRYLFRGVDVFGARVSFRRRDGRHLTDEGGREVARRLLEELLALGLRAASDPHSSAR